eukprot:1020823-Pelagomonas_calceolata.AAC.3
MVLSILGIHTATKTLINTHDLACPDICAGRKQESCILSASSPVHSVDHSAPLTQEGGVRAEFGWDMFIHLRT